MNTYVNICVSTLHPQPLSLEYFLQIAPNIVKVPRMGLAQSDEVKDYILVSNLGWN